MSETPTYETEPTTSPVATAPPPATFEERPAYVEPARKPNRLYQVAAWVAIVAGSVFIVAVIFFAGFALGACSGGGHHGGHRTDDWGMMRGDGPPMVPMRPGFIIQGPAGPGPGFGGPGFMMPGPGGPGFGAGPGNSGQGQQPPVPGVQQRPS